MRSRPSQSILLCAPLFLCALRVTGGFIHSPTGVMQEVTRSCSVLRIAAARRAARSSDDYRELPARHDAAGMPGDPLETYRRL